MPGNLIEELPGALERKLRENLSAEELIEVQLKGAWKEALICTDRRVMIIKAGIMTGQMFGSSIFQVPYSNIAGVEVKFSLLSGYFELSAGGMQNSPKSYWSSNASTDPGKSPNCVALNARAQAARFREACSYILQRIDQARSPSKVAAQATRPNLDGEDTTASLQRLWQMKTDGVISQAEFDVMKGRLLSKFSDLS